MTNEDALYLVDNLDKKDNWIVFDGSAIVSEKNISGIITSNKTYIRTDNGMMIVVSTNNFIRDFKINKMWLTTNHSDACVLINVRAIRNSSHKINSIDAELIFNAEDESNVDNIIDKYNLT